MAFKPENQQNNSARIVDAKQFSDLSRNTREEADKHHQRMTGWASSRLAKWVSAEVAAAGVEADYAMALAFLNASRRAALQAIQNSQVNLTVNEDQKEVFAPPSSNQEHTELS